MFEGTPRHKLLYAKLLNPLTSPQPSIYEGVFVYTFEGQQGLVINHRLESMSPTPWVPKVCRWWLDRKAKARQQTQEERDRGGNGLPQLNSGKRSTL
ncbi:hypothetical protein HDU99_001518 [Rhizoclosmatium hyalinum]|nr:hypothetical protein HDU99_001518 [Rhizoclosmatium hyalinum]